MGSGRAVPFKCLVGSIAGAADMHRTTPTVIKTWRHGGGGWTTMGHPPVAPAPQPSQPRLMLQGPEGKGKWVENATGSTKIGELESSQQAVFFLYTGYEGPTPFLAPDGNRTHDLRSIKLLL